MNMSTLLQRPLVVIDGFAVVVCLDERLADLTRQHAVFWIALQRSLVHFNSFFWLKTKVKPFVATRKHVLQRAIDLMLSYTYVDGAQRNAWQINTS